MSIQTAALVTNTQAAMTGGTLVHYLSSYVSFVVMEMQNYLPTECIHHTSSPNTLLSQLCF